MNTKSMRMLGAGALVMVMACEDACPVQEPVLDHGPIAENVMAPLGEIVPYATDEQREIFEHGQEVALHRFSLAEGLGPAFNVTFCASCHEKPVLGGSAGLYRNFFLGGFRAESGAFFPTESAGRAGGVVRMYAYDSSGEVPARPAVAENINTVAQRNPIPFFGVGLLAELSNEAILANADPDDADGDGISGRPNYDQGFVGRFGRKSQTVSIEGFIRGPVFNHMGVTTDPLTEAQRAALPVDSSGGGDVDDGEGQPLRTGQRALAATLQKFAQAAAPAAPLTDDDGVPDPELVPNDLFDLVSFAMLLAAPPVQLVNDETRPGQQTFDAIGCNACHVPRLTGPRGPLPVYSDLLLHDMGESLADGLDQGEATASEFRTQPLWGLAAVGPYLHDGRASTVEEAILMHDGEGKAARDRYAALSEDKKQQLYTFLMSLGGADQFSPGLLHSDYTPPAAGEYGGPMRDLDDEEQAAFLEGARMFDREFTFAEGVGAPRFNGDSCRACHFEPTIGGSGPRGVNVMRHGIINGNDEFVPPQVGTILHKVTRVHGSANQPVADAKVFEHRNTPHLFGLGLIDAIADDVIIANADPEDLVTPDGISGRAAILDGGRLGRFGWKAQVPSIAEFVRDAVMAELGMTLPAQEGLTFGAINDNDEIPDPEMTLDEANTLLSYLELLGPPPRQTPEDADAAARGEALFETVQCAACHIPSLDGATGPVPLYSDLLLHETLPDTMYGIEDSAAGMREFRTAPLWGLSQTAPYMHNGAADTIAEAIEMHAGEAAASRDAYDNLSAGEQDDLLMFLSTL